MSRQTPCPDAGQWSELLEGQLPAREQADLGRHLEACPVCQQTLEGLTAGEASWPDTARSLALPRPYDPVLSQAIEGLKAEAGAVTEPAAPAASATAELSFLRQPTRSGHLGRLGAYEVLEVLGRGGMGVVLKALDAGLGRLVAIKVLAPQWATSEAARQRFAREARATAAVRHDNVVAVYAVEEVDGLPYLVMEYVPGVSLQQHLEQTGPLELEEILGIGTQTASGLAAAHARGLIHRDVKPANILLVGAASRAAPGVGPARLAGPTGAASRAAPGVGPARLAGPTDAASRAAPVGTSPAGQVKLSDFGLARAIDDASLTQSGTIAGTPQYMAPEQARGAELDCRADLFSLGSVLYALCTGRPPFLAPTTLAVLRSVCEDTPTPIRELNPAIPYWLVEIIDVLLAKDPADRFQTADEVSQLLGQHLYHLRSPALVRKPRRLVRRARPRPRPKRHRFLLLILGVVLLGLAGWGGWLAFGPRTTTRETEQLPAEEGPAVLFSNAQLTRQIGQSLFQVDYRLPRGNLPAGQRYVWVIQFSQGLMQHKQSIDPTQLGPRGTLRTTLLIPPPLGVGDVLETYLAIDGPGPFPGQRRQISNVLSIAR